MIVTLRNRLYQRTGRTAFVTLSNIIPARFQSTSKVGGGKRRIIIAFDGTGRSSTRGDPSVSTNVSRLCRALCTSHNGNEQIVFYQSGIGTGSLGRLYSYIAGGTGLGMDDHILDAYMFLANNYLSGDEISIFGFSRGAFAGRVLAGLVTTLGLFRKSYLWELKRAYKAYGKGDAEYCKYVQDLHSGWKRGRARHVKIKVVGCWDTVGSVGLPKYFWVDMMRLNKSLDFYDPKLRYGIENAFHALAIDEIRYPFSPTLWYLPNGHTETESEVNLQQVWFPGVHSNVGGGYADHHLADISLAWMISKCQPFLDFDQDYIRTCVKLNHHPYTIKSSLREKEGFDKVYPGWGRGKIYDSFKAHRMSGVLWWKYRKPGRYDETDGVLGDTREQMHASVRERWLQDASWRPEALKGVLPEEGADGQWRWKGDGTLEIPEAPLDKNSNGFENLLRNRLAP